MGDDDPDPYEWVDPEVLAVSLSLTWLACLLGTLVFFATMK